MATDSNGDVCDVYLDSARSNKAEVILRIRKNPIGPKIRKSVVTLTPRNWERGVDLNRITIRLNTYWYVVYHYKLWINAVNDNCEP